jgi:hypothetical protein
MLQKLPLKALKFRSPSLRALVAVGQPESITRIPSALSNIHNSHNAATPTHRTFATDSSKKDMVQRTVFSGSGKKKIKKSKAHSFVPLKAPVQMTETARKFFKALLETKPEAIGIMLKYHQSSTGEPRMVFSFDFATEVSPEDESASLELLADGVTPKPPVDSMNDGLPKLYIHHDGFMKVLGGTVDVDLDTMKLTLYDREGNVMDPNNT